MMSDFICPLWFIFALWLPTDHTCEDVVVLVAHCERADGHDLRDGAEAEHRGLLQPRHVVYAARDMRERVCDLRGGNHE